jgi:hypothetical protein
MRVTAHPAEAKGKPGVFPARMLSLIEVLLVLVAGWLGIRALLDFVIETRNRDAATVQGYLDSRPQEEEHLPAAPAVALPVKAVPVAAVKARSRPASPAARTLEARPVEQKAK